MRGGGAGEIVAVVAPSSELVEAGSATVFIHGEEEVRKTMALYLAKLSQGVVHELEGGIYVIARH